MPPTTSQPISDRASSGGQSARVHPRVHGEPTSAPQPAVSSGTNSGATPSAEARPASPGRSAHDGHGLVAVGPGFAGPILGSGAYGMNPLPVQPAKIHCPLKRSDTLSRPRLNSWLEQAAAGRLGLIIAEAGFGKTTLLGDWARHTRRMTAWYRLEADDRDWLTFVRHLVASGRELQPGFAPTTFAMLLALGTGGPTQKDLVLTIAREMAEFGTRSERGLTLIIDDYHLVDGFDETEPIVRALLDRTGPGFSVILASRSKPSLAVGRLRARGGVMALSGQDLRFDVAETSSLFRDAYRHPLDQDLVSDLCERTDGWPALLTLVNARLAERQDPRDFVAHLRASASDMYDFLAEEVLASLPSDLTDFLMRASVLTTVDVASAISVGQVDDEHARRAIADAERLGLLTKPDRVSPHRFHPLVQEFLQTRLAASIGGQAVRDLHRSLAVELRAFGWNVSAWHYLMAGDIQACASVVDSSLEEIIAAGEFELARGFLDAGAGDPDRPTALILRSRLELQRGDFPTAVRWARVAVEQSAGGTLSGLSLLTLASTLGVFGVADEAAEANARALREALTPPQRYVALANLTLMQASQEGDLLEIAESLRRLAADQEREGRSRYAGVSRLNLSGVLLWLGDAADALREASLAETLLGGRAHGSVERVSATMMVAAAEAQLGRLAESRAITSCAAPAGSLLANAEVCLEAARIETEFGSADEASVWLQHLDPTLLSRGHVGIYNLLVGETALRQGDTSAALASLTRLGQDRCADAAGKLRTQILATRVALHKGDPAAKAAAEEASRVAGAQNTRRGSYLAALLVDAATGVPLDEALSRSASGAYCWSLLAEELVVRLHLLSAESRAMLEREAKLRPDRWRSPVVQAIRGNLEAAVFASAILAEVGSAEDAALLRKAASTNKSLRPSALAITKRLAGAVTVSDLGAVEVFLEGEDQPRYLRRKVLSLVCFLASRPRMSANREEVIEALWPELGVEAGGNSLHQAIYFLRRVLEPDYREGMSAGYIQFDGDVVSLNDGLVNVVSRKCWLLIDSAKEGDDQALFELLRNYRGRYALTFAYEEWASTYRENLHAAVLAASEAEMTRSQQRADYDAAIRVGQAVLAVDPQADAIELELLRAYKRSGRRAAAAEQYAHYAAYVRSELAAEPPSYEDI